LPIMFSSLSPRGHPRFFALWGEKTTHNNDKVPCCRRRKLRFA